IVAEMKIFDIISRTLLSLLMVNPQTAAASPASRPSEAEVERHIQRSALIGFEWVDQPLDRIMLLRSGNSLCAVRFTSYHRADDARSPTAFDTGDASRYASYEISELVVSGPETRMGPAVRKELDDR